MPCVDYNFSYIIKIIDCVSVAWCIINIGIFIQFHPYSNIMKFKAMYVVDERERRIHKYSCLVYKQGFHTQVGRQGCSICHAELVLNIIRELINPLYLLYKKRNYICLWIRQLLCSKKLSPLVFPENLILPFYVDGGLLWPHCKDSCVVAGSQWCTLVTIFFSELFLLRWNLVIHWADTLQCNLY